MRLLETFARDGKNLNEIAPGVALLDNFGKSGKILLDVDKYGLLVLHEGQQSHPEPTNGKGLHPPNTETNPNRFFNNREGPECSPRLGRDMITIVYHG